MKNFLSKQKYPQILSFLVIIGFCLLVIHPANAQSLVQCGTGDSPDAANSCGFNEFIQLIQRVMNFLLFVVAVPFAAISFAWAGWLYLSAAGNEGNVKKAHEIFGSVALGLCIALAAWLIVRAIISGLGVSTTYNFLG
jgi:hypothetical protein